MSDVSDGGEGEAVDLAGAGLASNSFIILVFEHTIIF